MIKAIYWTGENTNDVLRLMFDDLEEDAEANEGTVRSLKENGADIGYWILVNESGSISSCKPEDLHLYLGSCSEQGIGILTDFEGIRQAILTHSDGDDTLGFIGERLGVEVGRNSSD